MTWLLLTVATISFCECLLRLPFKKNIANISMVGKRAYRIILNKNISDHRKEKILSVYAGKIFCASLTLFLLLLISIFPFIVFQYLAALANINLFEQVAEPYAMLLTSAGACMYIYARKSLSNG